MVITVTTVTTVATVATVTTVTIVTLPSLLSILSLLTHSLTHYVGISHYFTNPSQPTDRQTDDLTSRAAQGS